MTRRPAVLGGAPAFPEGLPFARVSVPPLDRVTERLRPSYEVGRLTDGKLVRDLEEAIAERLGARHVVAVSSGTAGLMLALRVIAASDRPVLLPSFTFSASAHAVAWNGLVPRFADCDGQTFHLDHADAEARLGEAGVIMPTHLFGAPCEAERFEALARRTGRALVFDAAHGFGARRQGRPVGSFGDAEVFSLSPTKLLTSGEGGLIATPHDDVARSLRSGRDYGNSDDEEEQFVGFNARMSELHAALALEALLDIDAKLARRRELGRRYYHNIDEIPGLRSQAIDDGDEVTYKAYSIVVEPEYGVDRDVLVDALQAEGIETRRYFWPAVHEQRPYASSGTAELPVSSDLASRVVTLPIWPAMSDADVDTIADVLTTIRSCARREGAAPATSPTMNNGADRWERDERTLSRCAPTFVMLLSPDGDEPIVLRGTGVALWQALDRAQNTEELANRLAAEFHADPAAVRADIEPVIKRLSAAGVLRAVS
jgi:dTDP-4-amino-4,6-dideoxygalactose transaminase